MVYSTCSMNPVENEAVVAEVNPSLIFQVPLEMWKKFSALPLCIMYLGEI